jgi:LemA protein
MANSDEILQAYLNKMLNLQSEKRDRPFTTAELKQMALDMGMSEEDWNVSQQAFENHLKSGQGHLMYENWEDAIKDLANAIAFNPNSVEAAYGLARAYQGQFEKTNEDSDKKEAIKYAELALQLRPGHQPTVKVLDDLREEVAEVEQSKKTKYWWSIGIAVALGVILFLVYTSIFNAVVAKKELVKQKWAQVENVYQRRADLIPKLVNAVKNERNFEQDVVKKLQKAYGNVKSVSLNSDKLEESDLSAYQDKQNEVSNVLNQLMNKGAASSDLQKSQAFRDLQTQMEGSENRISVERKKYNEAVSDYNSYIKTFPNNLLGFKEIAYLKMDKDAIKKGQDIGL